MILKQNHEIVGTLSKVKFEENQIKLIFSILKEIELPEEAFSYEQLQDFLGKRIGIFNINGTYKIRHIKKLYR